MADAMSANDTVCPFGFFLAKQKRPIAKLRGAENHAPCFAEKTKGYTSSSECETISFFKENTRIPAHAGVPLFPQSFHEGETGTLRAGIASDLLKY